MERKSLSKDLQANLIAGILTIIPLIVVWFVLDFIFTFLSTVGSPVASGLSMFIADRMPAADYTYKPVPDVRTYARVLRLKGLTPPTSEK